MQSSTKNHHAIRWTGRAALAALLAAAAAGCVDDVPVENETAVARQRIVFGTDDRLELGAVTDPRLLGWARATAALFTDGGLACSATTCALATAPLTQGDVGGGNVLPLCPGERFRNQRAGGICTAFLVGPDLVATAGHCMQSQADCDGLNVVFGFSADANGMNERTSIPRGDVYACVDLIAQVFTGTVASDDWALFRVDRAVTGRTPLAVRRTGMVPDAAQLAGIGHPLSLPLKVSLNGAVRGNNAAQPKFEISLDASPGNSGSPVFNLQTSLVEGIISAGPTPEWVQAVSNGAPCATARLCSETAGCGGGPFPEWSRATRISGVVAALEGRSCHDDLRNGQETDVDCGGPECVACDLGQRCTLDRDCPFRSVCQAGICVPGPECVVAADCLGPGDPACLRATCTNNQCNLDFGLCECRINADCDDGRACTEDICFGNTLSCIHIETNCQPACTEATAVDLGAPGTSRVVPNDGCVRVRDGYPFWWGTNRRMILQTNGTGTYPVPFTWTNTCAGGSGAGTFTGNWQQRFLNPTSSACATLIDLQGNGAGNVSLWYFGQ